MVWLAQLEGIPYAISGTPSQGNAVKKTADRWKDDNVETAAQSTLESSEKAERRHLLPRRLVERRKAEKSARASERICDRHFQLSERPQILQEATTSHASSRDITAQKSQDAKNATGTSADKGRGQWDEHKLEAEVLLKVMKKKEETRRARPQTVQNYRHGGSL